MTKYGKMFTQRQFLKNYNSFFYKYHSLVYIVIPKLDPHKLSYFSTSPLPVFYKVLKLTELVWNASLLCKLLV